MLEAAGLLKGAGLAPFAVRMIWQYVCEALGREMTAIYFDWKVRHSRLLQANTGLLTK